MLDQARRSGGDELSSGRRRATREEGAVTALHAAGARVDDEVELPTKIAAQDGSVHLP